MPPRPLLIRSFGAKLSSVAAGAVDL